MATGLGVARRKTDPITAARPRHCSSGQFAARGSSRRTCVTGFDRVGCTGTTRIAEIEGDGDAARAAGRTLLCGVAAEIGGYGLYQVIELSRETEQEIIWEGPTRAPVGTRVSPLAFSLAVLSFALAVSFSAAAAAEQVDRS